MQFKMQSIRSYKIYLIYIKQSCILKMWYNYVNRATEQVRIWRRANLKFNQDDIGMFKTKYVGSTMDKIFRMGRTEGAVRGCFMFTFFASVAALSYVKKHYYDPVYVAPALQKERQAQRKNDQQAFKKLYINRVGAPSRPNRSLDDLMIFVASAAAINSAADFITYEGATQMSDDQLLGLDGIMSEEDAKMMKYYKESLKYKSHH